MTTVAGILNKQGVAIAADSAVTVTGMYNRKVYNSANKIFTLSKHHPVGIAIYNSAQFMGIPWETLIKEYRSYIGRRSFSKLEDYKVDFFKWLKANNYFIEKDNDNYLLFDFASFTQAILNSSQNIASSSGNKEEDLITSLKGYISHEIPQGSRIENLQELSEKDVKKTISSLVPQIITSLENKLEIKFSKEKIEKKLIDAYFLYLTHDQFLQFTGLIFVGYGDKELFPRLLPVNVSVVINDCLKFADDKNKEAIISDHNNSCINPFAQTDVIDTILRGISPELYTLSSHILNQFTTQFIQSIAAIEGMPPQLKQHLEKMNVSGYINKYQEQLENVIRDKHVNPLMGAVSHLAKEDLAEMAESLVYLTYLKRRFTMAEESVGGPVDVAVITKGDGFIWIKRKHYFDPKLNQNFIQKYF